ncbi:hypothetical protein [Rhizobium leguminosarum]|uniref:hypothetical protein n=1 Tax=Rhizobium leguminosarum TaxID=384 RepID=UPI0011AE5DDD|nr:hypothetical protein [Rhizobium leguminosarum]
MREYLTVPSRVEVVRAQEIIAASENRWDALPDWVGESYERGQMVVATTGVTLFNGAKAIKAMAADLVVRDCSGIFSVYDQTSFEQNFFPAHSADVFKLHAA